MTQKQLADIIGEHQTKVSKLLRGVTDGFSSDKLLDILNRLDQDVEIIIRPKPENAHREASVQVAMMKDM